MLGVSGTTETLLISEPLVVQCGNQTFSHDFLLTNSCSLPLYGRDMLIKMNAVIHCLPEGIVSFPDETKVKASEKNTQEESLICLMSHAEEELETTDIRTL